MMVSSPFAFGKLVRLSVLSELLDTICEFAVCVIHTFSPPIHIYIFAGGCTNIFVNKHDSSTNLLSESGKTFHMTRVPKTN